jgi:hypothetical protein
MHCCKKGLPDFDDAQRLDYLALTARHSVSLFGMK